MARYWRCNFSNNNNNKTIEGNPVVNNTMKRKKSLQELFDKTRMEKEANANIIVSLYGTDFSDEQLPPLSMENLAPFGT